MLFDRVIRAWKDPEFRQSLSEEDLASMPENPAGAIELSDGCRWASPVPLIQRFEQLEQLIQ